jgi:hypothetical protein
MLLKTAKLKEYMIELSGEIRGTIFEMYFDDLFWDIQYLLMTSDNIEKNKIFLISHLALGSPDKKSETIPLSANALEIERKRKPAVNKTTEESNSIDPIQILEISEEISSIASKSNKEIKDLIVTILRGKNSIYLPSVKHLRSHNEVLGYNIRAKDGDFIGHVDNFILEGNTWKLKYLLVETRNWLTSGKKILLSPTWIEKINWSSNLVSIDLSKDTITKSPTYDPDKPLNDQFEMQLYKYYGRHHYSA